MSGNVIYIGIRRTKEREISQDPEQPVSVWKAGVGNLDPFFFELLSENVENAFDTGRLAKFSVNETDLSLHRRAAF